MSNHQDACEFCTELHHPSESRFRRIYDVALPSRIVRMTPRFAVMPTLGQLILGSMLIVTRDHLETLAEAGEEGIPELCVLAEELGRDLERLGEVTLFEHGSRAASQGGCGIYHAHLHVVPLPRFVSARELLVGGSDAESFEEALRSVADSSEYLVVRDGKRVTRILDLASIPNHGFTSQYFRRRLTDILELDGEWDWRKYTVPELRVVQSVAMFSVEARGSARHG